MHIALSISPHKVTGLAVDSTKHLTKSFNFSLPFFEFRNLSKSYWDEVIERVLDICKVSKTEAKFIITAEESTYLSKSELSLFSSTFEILPNINQSIIYLGDYKGYANKNELPLIFDPQDFYKWFPQAENISEIENTFYNRQAYGILNRKDTWVSDFEQALFREKLSFVLQNTSVDYLRSTQDIILTGEGLIEVTDQKKLILSFLDGLNTFGFWRLYADFENILLNTQLIKHLDEELGKKIEDKILFEDLSGCLVIPESGNMELVFSDDSKIELKLIENSVSVVPLNKGDTVNVYQKLSGKEVIIEATGGKYGLIVDNRKRPLLSNLSNKERLELILRWEKEMNSKVDLSSLPKTTSYLKKSKPSKQVNKKNEA